MLVFVYSLYVDQTQPKTALKASRLASAAMSSSLISLCAYYRVLPRCDICCRCVSRRFSLFGYVNTRSNGESIWFARSRVFGERQGASGCARTNTHSGIQTHIYKCFHPQKHLLYTVTQYLSHTNLHRTKAQTRQCSKRSSR